jgi:hypothetical protein
LPGTQKHRSLHFEPVNRQLPKPGQLPYLVNYSSSRLI